MKVELTFLGTGTSSGVPMIGCSCDVCRSSDPRDARLRTSALVRVGGKTVVIDAGMDFRQQILRENVTHLDAVLLTHPHMDHIGGIDDLRAFNYFQKSASDIYCNSITAEKVRHMFSYAFDSDPYPGVPKLRLIEITEKPFSVGDIMFQPILGMHSKLPVFGYRVGNLTYLTDMNAISDEEIEKARGSRVLVINALRHKRHLSHFTLSQALNIAAEIGAEKTFLTHLSHQMGLHAEVQKTLPESVFVAYDGLSVEVE